MEVTTTDQPTVQSFSKGLDAMLQLYRSNKQIRNLTNIIVPVIAAASVAFLCILPFWHSGSGWISNSSIKNNVFSVAAPGTRFGSQTVYAKKGQTIRLDLDLHECKEGGLYVKIRPVRYGVSYKEYTYAIVEQAGKTTLTRTAEESGHYKIEFEPRGRKSHQSAFVLIVGGKTDLCFSASWEVN